MYVAKTLSSLRSSPHLMSLPPPEGPYSGILVIQDEHIADQDVNCFGVFEPVGVRSLPFPQNKTIGISYQSVMMIPVVNEPLSSNTYYVLQDGLAITCSSDEEYEGQDICWFLAGSNQSAKRQHFDPDNINQQMKIIHSGKTSPQMYAESLAYDAYPPSFMRKYNWKTTSITSPTSWPCMLNETEGQGLCERLRKCLPEFDDFPIGVQSSDHVMVGRWYVPCIFVKEFGKRYKDQMRDSMYYKMSLEQRWEKILEAENVGGESAAVVAEGRVKSEVVMLGGRVGVGGGRVVDGVVRYENVGQSGGGIGLSVGLVERMKWEQSSAGWVDRGGGDEVIRVRVEERYGWRRFGVYVLVERFVLKRMNGSLVLTHDFYHTHQKKTKWAV
ncbi:unnamed protein product [Rhodiola kirilowii]